jgi:hypothetical protein
LFKNKQQVAGEGIINSLNVFSSHIRHACLELRAVLLSHTSSSNPPNSVTVRAFNSQSENISDCLIATNNLQAVIGVVQMLLNVARLSKSASQHYNVENTKDKPSPQSQNCPTSRFFADETSTKPMLPDINSQGAQNKSEAVTLPSIFPKQSSKALQSLRTISAGSSQIDHQVRRRRSDRRTNSVCTDSGCTTKGSSFDKSSNGASSGDSKFACTEESSRSETCCGYQSCHNREQKGLSSSTDVLLENLVFRVRAIELSTGIDCLLPTVILTEGISDPYPRPSNT